MNPNQSNSNKAENSQADKWTKMANEVEASKNQAPAASDNIIDYIVNKVYDPNGLSVDLGSTGVAGEVAETAKYHLEDCRQAFLNMINKVEPGTPARSVLDRTFYRIGELGNNGEIQEDVVKVLLTHELFDGSSATKSNYGRKLYHTFVHRDLSACSGEDLDESDSEYKDIFIKLAKNYSNDDLWVQSKPEGYPEDETYGTDNRHGGFLHFGIKSKGGESPDLRCYITLNPTQRAKGTRLWYEALDESGVRNGLYYKMPMPYSTDRRENILTYKGSGLSDEKFKEVLQIFRDKCEQNPGVLSDDPVPTGIEFSKGMAIAPEPPINEYLKVIGSKGFSYNTFIVHMLELAAGLASERLADGRAVHVGNLPQTGEHGSMHSLGDPAMLLETKGAFKELLKISDIDPETMLPNSYGGKMPIWTVLNSAASTKTANAPAPQSDYQTAFQKLQQKYAEGRMTEEGFVANADRLNAKYSS